MRFITRGFATLATAIALAACSGTATQAPTTAAGTQAAPGSQVPGSQAPVATTATEATCADSTGATTVATTVAGNTWAQPLTAKVGDVITWTNSDSVSHRVATDDGSCRMTGFIQGNGGKASLVFSVPGTYPFHCTVHPSMQGTITIT